MNGSGDNEKLIDELANLLKSYWTPIGTVKQTYVQCFSIKSIL